MDKHNDIIEANILQKNSQNSIYCFKKNKSFMFIKKEVHSQVHKTELRFIIELHSERLPITC